MGLVLDTSALVELERLVGQEAAGDLPWEEELILPAVVWAEALVGVRLAKTALRAAQRGRDWRRYECAWPWNLSRLK